MKKRFEVHASVSKWIDETGKKCARTIQVGTIFESSHGRLVMKLEAIPTARDWSGWLSLRECAPVLPAGRRTSKGMPGPPPDTEGDNPDADVPF